MLSVANFTTTVPDNPASGLSLGSLEVKTNLNGLTYTIASQNPAGAITIDASTGVILIDDATLFDYETNPLIIATVTVSAGSLSDEADVTIMVDPLNQYELDVIDYFKEVALGFEFGGASQITRRWNTDMRVFVGGTPTAEHMETLEEIVQEINDLATTTFDIIIVDDTLQSNFYIHFGTKDSYAAMFPDQASLAQSNYGLFSIFWNGNNELFLGFMYVDIQRATAVEQKHLLREELTQSLGLGRDSDRYPESIFQQSFSTKTTEYAPIDRDLIRLLYHPDMKVGLGAPQVATLLREILEGE